MKCYSYKDITLSVFCLGCAQFGQKYGIANKELVGNNDAFAIIGQAVASGVNFFDTAADYGQSEEILGKSLSRPQKENLVIATKIKYLKQNNPAPAEIKKAVQESLDSSLRKLAKDCLDIVYIHQYELFFNFPDPFLEILDAYKKKGFIKHIGISLYQPPEIDQALKYSELEVFQIIFNALNRSFAQSGKINLLQEKNKLIVQRSIFLQGLFFIDPQDLAPFFSPVRSRLADFYQEIEKEFPSRLEFFLKYALNKNHGPLILGISSLSQLETNLKLFNSDLAPNAAAFQKIESKIPQLEDLYTDPRDWKLNLC